MSEWVPYERELWHNQKLPTEHRYVLLDIAPSDEYTSPAMVVGWLNYAAGDPHSPVFIRPGVEGEVVAWCDCLGDDFKTPRNKRPQVKNT